MSQYNRTIIASRRYGGITVAAPLVIPTSKHISVSVVFLSVPKDMTKEIVAIIASGSGVEPKDIVFKPKGERYSGSLYSCN